MFYVYILRSRSHPAQTYVGYSTDPRQRLADHNQGRCPHTSKFVPWNVVWYCGFPEKLRALAFESCLKSHSGKAFAAKRLLQGQTQAVCPHSLRYHPEPVDTMTADKIYERRWALTLLDEVLKRLRDEYTADGKGKLFDQLKETLTGERSSIPYAEIGQRLGMSEGAIQVAGHRLRQHYRDTLRAEIAETVAEPGEVEEELRQLFAALSL